MRKHGFSVEIFIKNADQRIEQHFEAQSYLVAFIGILNATVAQSNRTVTNTDDNPITVSLGSDQWQITADAQQLTGIQLGTGITAVSVDDNKLQTRIVDGSAAGQLVYGTITEDQVVTENATEVYFDIARPFQNDSGGNIDVKEIGLVCQAEPSFGRFMIDRSLNAFTILDTELKTITYRLKVTVI